MSEKKDDDEVAEMITRSTKTTNTTIGEVAGDPAAVAAAITATTATTTTTNPPSSSSTTSSSPALEEILLKDLVILPPRQKDGTTAAAIAADAVQKNAMATTTTTTTTDVGTASITVGTATTTTVTTTTTTTSSVASSGPGGESTAAAQHVLNLPPIRAEEPVQSLRAALAETIAYAHFTNFRFELEETPLGADQPNTSGGSNNNSKGSKSGGHHKASTSNVSGMKQPQLQLMHDNCDPLVSPYTGKDAVVSMPIQFKNIDPTATGADPASPNDKGHDNDSDDDPSRSKSSSPVVLDEFGDLTSLLGQGLRDGSGFRIVLERYDTASIKDHIIRLRSLLDGNAPFVVSLVDQQEHQDGDGPPDVFDDDVGGDEVQHNGGTTLHEASGLAPIDDTLAQQQPASATTSENKADDTVAKSSDEGASSGVDTKVAAPSTATKVAVSAATNPADPESAANSIAATTKPPKKSSSSLPDLPEYTGVERNAKVDGNNLEDFFYLAFGEDRKDYHLDNDNKQEAKSKETYGSVPSSSNSHNQSGKSKKKKKSTGANHKTGSTPEQNGSEDNHDDDNNNNSREFGFDDSNGGIKDSPIMFGASSCPAEVSRFARDMMPRLNELDEIAKVDCSIRYSGFHPPPPMRRYMGDLAYFEVTVPTPATTTSSTGNSGTAGSSNGRRNSNHNNNHSANNTCSNDTTIHITATATGFYVNRSIAIPGKCFRFDPSPASRPDCYFSHTLLDCLLKASDSFKGAWHAALNASRERTSILDQMSIHGSAPFMSFLRVATRGDYKGFSSTSAAAVSVRNGLDTSINTPTWLTPLPTPVVGDEDNNYRGYGEDDEETTSPNNNYWNRNAMHGYNPSRIDDDITTHTQTTFGIDVRNGGIRDWNEELQLAREMPISTLRERIERARLLHKVLTEFAEASLLGVKAIYEGHITSMNPNENIRTQVCLHNNIFFSRAVDTGPETFKIASGDNAAKKCANRDLHCTGSFHRMESAQHKTGTGDAQPEADGGNNGNNSGGGGLYTLATVLIDYLGTRYVCQSVLPGILIGDKSHTLLHGAVENGIPLKYDESFHKSLEEKIMGEGMMIATRPVLLNPLTDERMEEIELQKQKFLKNKFAATTSTTMSVQKPTEGGDKVQEGSDGDSKNGNDLDSNAIMETCVPIEAKGILGSDQRKYVLDFGRLTPRDANWVSKDVGGTGKYESELTKATATTTTTIGGTSDRSSYIPSNLDDDEWTMCVLRPELVTRFTQVSMARYIQEQRRRKPQASAAASKETDAKDGVKEVSSSSKAIKNGNVDAAGKREFDSEEDRGEKKEQTAPSTIAEERKDGDDDNQNLSESDMKHLKQLRLNINVFLPHMRSFEGINEKHEKQIKQDEERVREAATFLWEEVLPKITLAIKDGSVNQVPVDGKTLTEFLHRNGVNCRYMGRLATLAKEQEEREDRIESDLKQGRLIVIERRTMPKCWLELLECEMVARAAKHVLDSYLAENGGVAAFQPAQTIASFLSALVSETEETAAQTENRLEKNPASEPDEDDFTGLTISCTGGGGDAVPSVIRSRHEVWEDIEKEIGRRFRYSLCLYNTGGNSTGRALYIPLLRRVCQRTGVRLFAKNYEVGGRCTCGGTSTLDGRLQASYPISPLDISDIVPLMKHAAAYTEGFIPCTMGPTISLPALQVSLQDARVALERAHIQTGGRALGKGLELAQEAAALYQRVTENAAHPGVIESMDLMASILLEAGDPAVAAANGAKALALCVQSYGYDSASVISAHMSLFQMLFASRELDRSVKHLRAAIYLLEVIGGPRHTEHFTAYHKLGSVYSHADYDGKYLVSALKFFEEASKRDSCDRLMVGITAKSFAKVLAGLGEYKDALEAEKKAFRTLSMFLGKDHHLTKESDAELKSYTKLAVEKGSRLVEKEKMREQAAKAEAVAADLAAEEEEAKSKKHSNKSSGNHHHHNNNHSNSHGNKKKKGRK